MDHSAELPADDGNQGHGEADRQTKTSIKVPVAPSEPHHIKSIRLECIDESIFFAPTRGREKLT